MPASEKETGLAEVKVNSKSGLIKKKFVFVSDALISRDSYD
jgi:hypothetical protein